jgi:putative phosphonate catabolism associated alcohol dehydrogenase
MKKKAKAAVFVRPGKPFEIRTFDVPDVEKGAILAKVRMSTICGSDLHTWKGKRPVKGPSILGHEILGEIASLGENVSNDIMGKTLKEGDRVTWTVTASCGRCYYCSIKKIPQKCINLYKYGHEVCTEPPYLNGGMAEYIYLKEGTAVLKVSNRLSDEEVTPINCALATMINGLETIRVNSNNSIIVQGAGMLGIYTIALLKEYGAGPIICLDISESRLNIAKEFGADYIIKVSEGSYSDIKNKIYNLTGGYGADLVIEVTGNPAVIPKGVEMLGIGGSYLLVGSVFPGSNFSIDGNYIATKILTIKGIHNYSTVHLRDALRFIERTHNKYPYKKLIGQKYNLEEIDKAFEEASKQKVLRVAVVP